MVEYYTTFERKLYCAVRFSWIFHIKLILICSFRKCYSLFCISYGFWFTHSTSMLRATICLTKRMLNNSMLSLASLSISPELQFSEKHIQNILVFLYVFQQFWFQRSLICSYDPWTNYIHLILISGTIDPKLLFSWILVEVIICEPSSEHN